MLSGNRKVIGIVAIIIAIIAVGGLVFVIAHKKSKIIEKKTEVSVTVGPKYEVIGKSVDGRKIESYTYGTGAKNILFAGGMHGGYEWNSVLLAYKFIDYLNANPKVVPSDMSVIIIPSLNPDGVFEVTGKEGRFTEADVSTSTKVLAEGRFNANEVDLNRNFGCNWKPESMWQNKTVSAGTSAFSEPESGTLRDLVLKDKPVAAIFWHSQSGTVYASECNHGILPITLDIMNKYANAAGYVTNKSFDSYSITGDSEGWLASINIPAITVELKTHNTIEWNQNLAGFKAVLSYYSSTK